MLKNAQASVVQSPYGEADDEYRGLVSYLNSGEANTPSNITVMQMRYNVARARDLGISLFV